MVRLQKRHFAIWFSILKEYSEENVGNSRRKRGFFLSARILKMSAAGRMRRRNAIQKISAFNCSSPKWLGENLFSIRNCNSKIYKLMQMCQRLHRAYCLDLGFCIYFSFNIFFFKFLHFVSFVGVKCSSCKVKVVSFLVYHRWFLFLESQT